MDYSDILSRHGVRPTAVRMLVYKALQGFHDTFSMGDLEMALESVDRSTLFRALTLFTAHHIVHEIEDGRAPQNIVCAITTMHAVSKSCTATFIVNLAIRHFAWIIRIFLLYAILKDLNCGR